MKKTLISLIVLLCSIVIDLNGHDNPNHSNGCTHEHLLENKINRCECSIEDENCTLNGMVGKCKTNVGGLLGVGSWSICKCVAPQKPGKGSRTTSCTSDVFAIPSTLTFALTSSTTDFNILFFNDADISLCGSEVSIPNATGNFTIEVTASGDPNFVNFEVIALNISENSYDLCGEDTGVNSTVLDSGTPASGQINLTTGEISGVFYTITTNDLYDNTTPLVTQGYIDGTYDLATGCMEVDFNGNLIIPEIQDIPTLSQWSLIILALLMLIIGIISIKQNQIELARNRERVS